MLKTGHHDSIDLAVIISSVRKEVHNWKVVQTMTAESMLLKHSVLRFTATLFLSLSYFRPTFAVFKSSLALLKTQTTVPRHVGAGKDHLRSD